jgi:hypothetical protein
VQHSAPPEFELPSSYDVPAASGGWPPAARTAAGCGAGCAVAAILLGVGLWSLMAAMIYSPQSVSGKISAPAVVREGRPFPLVLTVHNTGDQESVLSAVVARDALADRLHLTAPEPAPSGEPIRMLGATTWRYERTLKPGEKLKITFQAIPSGLGPLKGELELQSGFVPSPVPLKVEVRAPQEKR